VKGWIAVPGIREVADRTLDEQMRGLREAFPEAKGKTVLDLGCAEGLIGREFALAGASRVVGIESLEEHLTVARIACADAPQMEFVQAYLQDWIAAHDPPEQFDVVLALGIIHKIGDPGWALRFACRSCRELLLFRAPAHAWNGWVTAKHQTMGKHRAKCHVPSVMEEEGFYFSLKIDGARGEAAEYWRRRKSA
jgi:2-polyprenyl-3-methyl-5-hydroxy-6-metoxy-1,4-benzoquinol methylase